MSALIFALIIVNFMVNHFMQKRTKLVVLTMIPACTGFLPLMQNSKSILPSELCLTSLESRCLLSSSVGTDSCGGQWWSTEQCWDPWREWSLYWPKTSEGNGEATVNHHIESETFCQAVQSMLTSAWLVSPSPRPLWLSPAQVMVIPVGGNSESYSKQVRATMTISFCCISRPSVPSLWLGFYLSLFIRLL